VERTVSADLDTWLAAKRRKPLVLRGARQVGKTWLVRDLATRSRLDLFELNFERDPRHARLFAERDPNAILSDISLALGREAAVGRVVLFLDEVQAAPEVLARLRWFAEELPHLPIMAAGSLLEFALSDHTFSMPVGRISFVHVEPMGFHEYLRAHGRSEIVDALERWTPRQGFSEALHERALEWFHRYAMVGGLPEVVAAEVSGATARECRELQRDLVATYRADFAKYSGRMDRIVIDSVLDAVARSLGRKFVYAQVGDGVKQQQAKRSVELLAAARLCHLVRHSAANGVPLGGEVKETFRKAILVDVGVFHALAGSPAAARFPRWKDLSASVRGQIAEQLAGQALRLAGDRSGDGPQLYYWQREGGRPGEIDYLIQVGGRVVPIELKSGTAGAMKSLHQFMFDKRLSLALRLDENPPSLMNIAVKTTQGDNVKYRLLGLPLYLAWRAAELVEGLV
jgi:predicted AAA+ superfamily ATPase